MPRRPGRGLLDLVLPQLPIPMPGRLPAGGMVVPSGWTLEHECSAGPPVEWNGLYGERSGGSAGLGDWVDSCLSGQAFASENWPQIVLRRPTTAVIGWQYPLSTTFRHRLAYQFRRSPGAPDGVVTFAPPALVPMPYRAVPRPLVPPHPDGLPDSGNEVPEPRRAVPWPERLPERLPTRDPARPRPLPWYPGKTAPVPDFMPGAPPRPGQQPVDVIVDGGGVDVTTDTVVTAPFAPHMRPRNRPPARTGGRVRERKQIANPRAASFLGRTLNNYTEALDWLNALHAALPVKYQAKPHRLSNGKWVPAKPHDKAKALFDNYEHIDIDKAIKNVAFMQAQDALIGQLNRGINQNLQPWYDSLGRPVGITVGPAI